MLGNSVISFFNICGIQNSNMLMKLCYFSGGVIELKATTSVTLDGKLLATGNIGYGPRAGGGAGGSVWIDTAEFYGAGNIDVTGGSVGTGANIVDTSGNQCKYFSVLTIILVGILYIICKPQFLSNYLAGF